METESGAKSSTKEENPRFSSLASPLLTRAARIASLIARNAPLPRYSTRFAVGATRKSLRIRLTHKGEGYFVSKKCGLSFGVKVSENLSVHFDRNSAIENTSLLSYPE